jgi:hypothetical protein
MESLSKQPPSLSNFFKRRAPAKEEIRLVFSMAAFCVFTWALRNYFYQFPALILSYNVWDLLSILAYTLFFALIESVLTTAFMVALAFLLPGLFLRKGFAYKGSFAIIAVGVISIHLQLVMSNQPKVNFLLIELARGLALWLVPVLLTRYVPFIRKIVLDVLDRLTIFSYVYFPLGILSLLVVFIRNLW